MTWPLVWLLVGMVPTVGFIVAYWRVAHRSALVPAAHYLMASSVAALLLLVLFGVQLITGHPGPYVLYGVLGGLCAVVFSTRLWLLWRAHGYPQVRFGGIMTRKFLWSMVERALRAGAAAVLATKGFLDPAVAGWSMNWLDAGRVFFGAALVSMLVSLAASQRGDHDSPSFLPGVER